MQESALKPHRCIQRAAWIWMRTRKRGRKMRISIPKEAKAGETRVAITPDSAKKLMKMGFEVCVQAGAGTEAAFPDSDYVVAGVKMVSAEEVWDSDVIVCIDMPAQADLDRMRKGAVLICRMRMEAHRGREEELASHGITALAMDAAPRISRAQPLDVRSSMANLSGYKAVVEAANELGRLFGGQMTAAGKVAPAKVYIIGVGVSGLAAIGTAGAMGAEVSATDVRPEVADQVESLGGTFIPIPVQQESQDGYAKAMGEDEQARVQQVYAEQARLNDVVITTAQVPGRPSPLLLTEEAIRHMKPGSVIVDLGASEAGSNTALTVPDEIVRTDNNVTIIGYRNLPDKLPTQASQLFGQNVVNLFKLLCPEKDGQVALDLDDEVIRAMTVCLDGSIMWPPPPVSVKAQPAKPSAQAAEPADAPEAQEAAAATSRWKGLWWKVLLGAVAMALILAAPESMQPHFIVFALAVVVGFYVITNVTHTLHTPLMSVTNAISGIIIVGALLQVGSADPVICALSFVAIAIASINIFGGFLVTNRMLAMFQRSSDS